MDIAEFLTRIEEVDALLALKGLLPWQRELHAFRMLAPNYTGPIDGFNPEVYPEFVGPNLLEHICEWYSTHYGDKMKGLGPVASIPLLIRSDIYTARIPLVLGQSRFDLQAVLQLIDGLTPHLRSSLFNEEMVQIWRAFKAGYELVYEMEDAHNIICDPESRYPEEIRQLLKSALYDRKAAVAALAGIKPAHPTAAFHSQQMAEKLPKAFLVNSGQTLESVKKKFGHNIECLHSECQRLDSRFEGVKKDFDLLETVKMDVRYSAPQMSGKESVDLFWAALRICGLSACAILRCERRYAQT